MKKLTLWFVPLDIFLLYRIIILDREKYADEYLLDARKAGGRYEWI